MSTKREKIGVALGWVLALTIASVAVGAQKEKRTQKAKPAPKEQVTLLFKGLDCDGCVKTVSADLAKVAGVKVVHQPTLRHPQAVVELEDSTKADLAELVDAVVNAQTPHRDKEVPSASLVLFDKSVKADAGSVLAKALEQVKGIDAKAITVDEKRGEIYVPLVRAEKKEDGASLAAIMIAMKSAGFNVRSRA